MAFAGAAMIRCLAWLLKQLFADRSCDHLMRTASLTFSRSRRSCGGEGHYGLVDLGRYRQRTVRWFFHPFPPQIEGVFFRHANASFTLSIDGCVRFFTLIQSGDRPGLEL